MIYQGEIAECGLACSAMLLNTLGENVTLSELRDKWGGSNGSSLDLLVNLLKSYGHEAVPIKFDNSTIQHLPTPCILHYGGNHYVYVYSQHGSFFQVLNPATGRLMIMAKELALSATGYAVILDETLYQEKRSSGKVRHKNGWLETLSFPGLYKRCLLAIFLSLFALITPMLFTSISNDQEFFKNEQINLIFIGMIFLFTFVSFLQYLSSSFSLSAAIGAATKYKPSLFKKLLKKDISYFERRTTGDINQRLNSVGMALLTRELILNDKYKSLLITLVTLVIMLSLDIVLSLLSITTMAIFGFISYYYAGIKKAYSKSLEESMSEMETFSQETINGIQTVRSGALDTRVINGYNKLLDIFYSRYKKLSSTDIRKNTIFSFLGNIDLVLFLWVSFYSISEMKISYSSVIAFWFFRKIAMDSINQYYQCCVSQKLQKVSDDRLADMLTYKEINTTRQKMQIVNSVRINNLEFGYGPESTVFDDLSINIQLRSKTAIIGASGKGKSTLLKILAGLYSPRSVNIYNANKKVGDDKLHLLFSNMYYLPQGAIIFNATIFDNIVLYSGGDADEHDCCAMLKKFDLLDVVTSLPEGLNTKISPSNPILSSGQMQRLMLCRALLSSKEIILLDEPTANLDDKNSMITFDALLNSEKTIVISTHDTKILSKFDNVINLD